MEYTIGNTVTIDGTLIGELARIIFAPHSKEVTHIVIEQLPKPHMKIVPVELIDLHTKHALVLKEDLVWKELLNFHGEYYESVNGTEYKLRPKSYLHPLYHESQTHQTGGIKSDEDRLNIGMPVFDKSGQECGEVIAWQEDIEAHLTYSVMQITDDNHEVQIPVRWISHTKEQVLYLRVDCGTLMDHHL